MKYRCSALPITEFFGVVVHHVEQHAYGTMVRQIGSSNREDIYIPMKTNSAGETLAENPVNALFKDLSLVISSRLDNVRSTLDLKVRDGPIGLLSHFSSCIADGVRRVSTSSQQYIIEARFWKVRPRFESNSMWLPNPPPIETYFMS